MIICRKNNLPVKQRNKNTSMYVFIYYTDNTRFCLGYYDFDSQLWIDSDGMVITKDLLWCYLPVKQMKAFIENMSIKKRGMICQTFEIDGEPYLMFNLEIKGKRINVGSFGLEEKISEMIDQERYEEVRHIDEMYSYYVPKEVDETSEQDVRDSIESVYEE